MERWWGWALQHCVIKYFCTFWNNSGLYYKGDRKPCCMLTEMMKTIHRIVVIILWWYEWESRAGGIHINFSLINFTGLWFYLVLFVPMHFFSSGWISNCIHYIYHILWGLQSQFCYILCTKHMQSLFFLKIRFVKALMPEKKKSSQFIVKNGTCFIINLKEKYCHYFFLQWYKIET